MNKELGLRFKALRKELRLTQVQMADKLGVSQANITDIERGKIGVSSKVSQKLIATFQVNTGWLDTGKGEIFIKENNVKIQGKNTGNNTGGASEKEGRFKNIAFWQQLRNTDKDLDNLFTELSYLQSVTIDLEDFLEKINQLVDKVENNVTLNDYKIVTSDIFIQSKIKELSILKKFKDTIIGLGNMIGSEMVRIDTDSPELKYKD